MENRVYRYILTSDGQPAPCESLMVWAYWLETSDEERRIGYDEIAPGVAVSTVFLGIDHNFFGNGPPILFETMIFGGRHTHLQRRYCTRAEAEAGHKRTVEHLRGELAAKSGAN